MRFFPSFDPRAFFDALAGRQGATWCYLVPAMWEMVHAYAHDHPELRREKPWPQLRVMRSAGADLQHGFACELADLFGDAVGILPTYGMTEAMPIAAPPVSYRLERPGSVGRVLPPISIEIVDPSEGGQLKALPPGATGEISVDGPAVVAPGQGAYPSPDVFTPRGYFRTGDLGRLAPDGSGWLFVSGRIKEAINRAGETIAPAEVEASVRAYPGWADAGAKVQLMAFARAHRVLGEDVALAVASQLPDAEFSDFGAWAQRHLPSSSSPQMIILVPELPRSATGKPLRARFADHVNKLLPLGELGALQVYTLDRLDAVPRLRWQFDTSQFRNADDPATDVTLDAVLAIVRDYVGDGVDIGLDTRLDDAGVNSLAAVELSEILNQRFGSELSQWVVSDFPTPRALWSRLVRAPAMPGLGNQQFAPPLKDLHFTRRETRPVDDRETVSPATKGDSEQCLALYGRSPISADLWRALLEHTQAWEGGRAHSESLVFGLNCAGPRQPVFWCFQRFQEFSQLAAHLGADQPLYGMRSGVDVMEKSQANIETLARHYALEIQSIQPSGPFIIGGTCQAAKIAFQIARALRKDGHDISLLCLHEQVVPFMYSGRVALFLGRKSDHSPAHYFVDPAGSWRTFYSGKCTFNITTANHVQQFKTPHIRRFAKMLRAELDTVRSVSDRLGDPAGPVLPPEARRAVILASQPVALHPQGSTIRVDVEITNASDLTWPGLAGNGVVVGYWLFGKENVKPPVFYGLGARLTEALAPGQSVMTSLDIAIPNRPGSYRAEIDLLDNGVSWFRFNGSSPASITIDVRKTSLTGSFLKSRVARTLRLAGHRASG